MEEKTGGLKGFFKKLVEKIDKKMEEKAKQSSCCGGSSGHENHEDLPSKDSCCK